MLAGMLAPLLSDRSSILSITDPLSIQPRRRRPKVDPRKLPMLCLVTDPDSVSQLEVEIARAHRIVGGNYSWNELSPLTDLDLERIRAAEAKRDRKERRKALA